MAPSAHNTQPWRFAIDENTVRIFPDRSRRLPAADPDDHALFISLGCALENLVVAARRSGYEAQIDYFPPSEPEDCLRVRLKHTGKRTDGDLCNAIPDRQSTRRPCANRPIPHEYHEILKPG